MARISLQGLGHSYADQSVIDRVDLDIEDGEFLTLLGPSGCGKTTTLRIVAGFLVPDAGRVHFDGKDMTRVPTQRRNLGMVFQDYALFPHLSIADNVGFALKSKGVPKSVATARVDELLRLIRLPDIGQRYPAELSGGQQQRVAIARALAHTPSVLLMDEPLGALDLKLREAMQDELHAIQRQLGITTLYVTHDQEEALSLSHRIALMRHGRIEQLGTPKDIYSFPKTPFAAFFLGKVNFLVGHVRSVEATHYDVAVEGKVIRCPVRQGAQRFAPGEEVILGVRPESLRMVNEGEASQLANRLQGRIARQKFVGKAVQFELDIGATHPVIVDGTLAQASGEGGVAQVAWDPEATHIYPFVEDAELGLVSMKGSPAQRPSVPIASMPMGSLAAAQAA